MFRVFILLKKSKNQNAKSKILFSLQTNKMSFKFIHVNIVIIMNSFADLDRTLNPNPASNGTSKGSE